MVSVGDRATADWANGVQSGFVVPVAYLCSTFSVGTGGASAGTLTIPDLKSGGILLLKLEVTPPSTSPPQITSLLSYSGDSRLSSAVGPFRTPVTSSTTNKHDFAYWVPVAPGASGTSTFMVYPSANGCLARLGVCMFGVN